LICEFRQNQVTNIFRQYDTTESEPDIIE